MRYASADEVLDSRCRQKASCARSTIWFALQGIKEINMKSADQNLLLDHERAYCVDRHIHTPLVYDRLDKFMAKFGSP